MNEKGFTLVETLAALVVGAMLLGSISWVISGLTRDLTVAEVSDQTREISQASVILNRILSSARFTDQDGNNLARSNNFLTFEMPAPDALRQSGYVRAALSSEQSAGGRALFVEFPDTNFPKSRILDGVKSVSLEFVEKDDQSKPGSFLRKIKVSILVEAGNEPHLINIHPKIDSVGACIFDVISQRCRS